MADTTVLKLDSIPLRLQTVKSNETGIRTYRQFITDGNVTYARKSAFTHDYCKFSCSNVARKKAAQVPEKFDRSRAIQILNTHFGERETAGILYLSPMVLRDLENFQLRKYLVERGLEVPTLLPNAQQTSLISASSSSSTDLTTGNDADSV